MIFLRNRPGRALATRRARPRFDPCAFGLVPREQLDPLHGGPAPAADHVRAAVARGARKTDPASG